MNRRAVLSITGVASITPLIGCLNKTSSNKEDTDKTNADKEDTNKTDTNEYQYDESRKDPIFIENLTSDEEIVDIVVEEATSDEILVENTYKIPGETGAEIPDIARVGEEYSITAEHGGTVEKYDWTVLTCAHEDGPEAGGETALGIGITEEELRIAPAECDMVGPGENFDLSYYNHEKYIQ